MAHSNQDARGRFIFILLSAVPALGFFLILGALPIPQVLPCVHPSAQNLSLALTGSSIVHLLAGARFFPRYRPSLLAIDACLLLLVIWLGAYRFSPLGLSSRENILREFVVMTPQMGEKHIPPNGIISVGNTSVAYIQPILGPGNIKCSWYSLHGGGLDGQESCPLLYTPPSADFDILKVNLQPGCGLPNTVQQIRISILP